MTTITIQTPVEIDLEDCLANADLHPLLQEVNRRFLDNIHMTKAQFLDLVDCFIEMRNDDAFNLMEAIAPNLVNAKQAKQRFLHLLINRPVTSFNKEAIQ